MASPVSDSYSVASGLAIYGGKPRPARSGAVQPVGSLGSVSVTNTGQDIPWSQQLGRPLVLHLHASGSPSYNGLQHVAQVSGRMSFPGFEQFQFNLIPGARYPAGQQTWHISLRPNDIQWGLPNAGRQSLHIGFRRSDGFFHLIAERRYDALMAWALQYLTQYDLNARVIEGGSMGGWAAAVYGIRRYEMFAAIYPDRPRFRSGFSVGELPFSDWDSATIMGVPAAQGPLIAQEDGGGTLAAYRDMVAYVSNPANKVRWIGWVIGRADGYATWDDQLAMVDALRATGRGFAFAWNNGRHAMENNDPSTAPPSPDVIQDSYPFGTFRMDRGWPVFTEHSLDQDPRVDIAGGINIGLSFRNVVETASGWSCEVTSIRGACTVKVKPYSDVYMVNAAPKLITITGANQWQTVSFNAQGL